MNYSEDIVYNAGSPQGGVEMPPQVLCVWRVLIRPSATPDGRIGFLIVLDNCSANFIP